MSQELIYTSAPQGLKPGTRGFCTVVATEGMAKNLAERLEALSGYRHAYMAHEGEAVRNPVNHAHYRIPLGGRRYHVLSRVCDAGLDYTQRTNKLAHHVALEPHEVAAAPGGPAWVLATPGFCVERWDGQVKTLPAGRRPTGEDCPTEVCRTWQRLAGDAGWAGVLAETASQPNQVMSVIFQPGTDTLALVVEALSLLPPEKRWEVTFSTYFTKTAAVDCQWRFILDGTPEAAAVRRDMRAKYIDLANPQPVTSGSALVTAAREGIATFPAGARRAGPAQRVAARPAPTGGPPREAPAEDASTGYRLAPPDLPSSSDSVVVGLPPPPSAAWKPSSRTRTILKAGIAVAVLVVVGAAAFLGGHFAGGIGRPSASSGQGGMPQPKLATPPSDEKPKVAKLTPEPDYDPLDLLPEDIRKEARKEQPKEDKKPAPEEFMPAPPTEPAPVEPPKPTRPPPFEDIVRKQNQLKLPPVTPVKVSAFEKNKLNTTSQELARLYVDDVKQCQLAIEGQEFAPRGGVQYRIERQDGNGERIWNLVSEVEANKAITKKPSIWAAFQLKEDTLSFQWKTQPPLRLQLCTLAITVGDKTARCRLSAVETVKAIPIDSKLPPQPVALKSLEATWREGDQVRVELNLPRLNGATFQTERTLKKVGSVAIVAIPNPHVTDAMGDKMVELEVALAHPSPGVAPRLRAEVIAHPERLTPGGGIQRLRQPLTAAAIEEWRKVLESMAAKAAEEILGKLERGQRTRWIKLPTEMRLKAMAYQELDNKMRELARDPNKRAEASRLVNRMDEEFSPEVRQAVSDCALYVDGRLDQVQQYEQAVTFVSAKFAWCDAMEKFQKELYNTGRLEYRVYLETQGGPIDLEMTEGFEAAPAQTK